MSKPGGAFRLMTAECSRRRTADRTGTDILPSTQRSVPEEAAAAAAPDVVRHNAFDAGPRNAGAPLLNLCGEVVGVAIDDDANPPSPGRRSTTSR